MTKLPEFTEEKCFQVILYNNFVLWLDGCETTGGQSRISLFFWEKISHSPEREYYKEFYGWKN